MDFAHMFIVSLAFPTFVYVAAPYILRRAGFDTKTHSHILIIACVVMFTSWYLPSPFIEGKDTSFTTHFIGGGIFCGLLWLYVKDTIKWRGVWLVEMATLYALTCALGVANELFELAMYKVQVMDTIADTSWDLLANTLGAALFYTTYKLWKK